MAVRVLDPYTTDPERLESFKRNTDAPDVLSRSVTEFRHVILALPDAISLDGLKVCITTALNAFIHDSATSSGEFVGVIEGSGTPPATHLSVVYGHYRPTALPPYTNGTPGRSSGVFPIIKTNNRADYVAFGARPAPAWNYDGSFRSDMPIRDLIIASSNTIRALRLCDGVIPHILRAL